MQLWVICALCFCGGMLVDMAITGLVMFFKKRKLQKNFQDIFIRKENE